MLDYHLPQINAMVAVGALALALLAVVSDFRRNDTPVHRRAVIMLFLLAIAIAIGAALFQVYPLGGTRHNIYLGPVTFLAAGIAFHSAANNFGALIRRSWLAPALVVMTAGVIALAGVVDVWQNSPYREPDNIDSILAVLDENATAGDLVYVDYHLRPWLRFYQKKKPDDYHYGDAKCWPTETECLRGMIDEAISHSRGSSRVWLISILNNPVLKRAAEDAGQISVEQVIAGGNPKLYLVTTADGEVGQAGFPLPGNQVAR